jgi:hypothetical protein
MEAEGGGRGRRQREAAWELQEEGGSVHGQVESPKTQKFGIVEKITIRFLKFYLLANSEVGPKSFQQFRIVGECGF